MYQRSFSTNADLPALTDYSTQETFTYLQLAAEVAKLHLLFDHYGVQQGDRIALVGRNTARWVISYMSVITYGAVIVPILQDFHAEDINHIIDHSESKLLFVGDAHAGYIDTQNDKLLDVVISLTDFSCRYERNSTDLTEFAANIEQHFAERYPAGFGVGDIKYADVPNQRMVLINYTSGTTGNSKGVMLAANSIASNVLYAEAMKLYYAGSKLLSYLPLAHAFGCAFDMLTPLKVGTHITLLGKLPTAKLMLEALQQVNPYMVCTVPLVVEKICKKQVFPLLERNPLKTLLKVPLLREAVYAMLRKKLTSAFGKNIYEVVLGGAAVDPEVESFLMKIKFPFTTGYGMTECGPLISYVGHKRYTPASCGTICYGMEARIDSADPQHITGEILVRGENVMLGYYKNPEATEAVLDSDGWLHTGDMGTIVDGYVFIKGRCKTMILLSNGQNIYPEQIEFKLNNLELVSESLVVEQEGKLVALVVPDYDEAKRSGLNKEALLGLMNRNIERLNRMVAPYEKVSRVVIRDREFEKTPKKSIKRYLYAVGR